MSIQDILEKVKEYHPLADLRLVEKAYLFAELAHRGTKRASGEPFIIHPVCVAEILTDLKLDLYSIVCGLLHDTLEDTKVTLKDLKVTFGEVIAELVEGVSHLKKITDQSHEERKIENLRKLLLATAKDIRVILVKLADRLHNIRTLEYLERERQLKVAHETLEIYAPLANRLGMGKIKWELEDLSFRCLEPEIYDQTIKRLDQSQEERERYIENIKKVLDQELKKAEIKAEITGRPKHIYSICQKIKAQNIEMNKIYDLQAFRIITESIKDCYAILGIAHTLFKPISHRFKDFIAIPKSNMYQSIHTSVIGPEGRLMEIQIRTWEMNKITEEGIAAHWMYKEKLKIDKEFNKKISWLQDLIEIQETLKSPKEFMENLKMELFFDEVFVFTPKGEVRSLLKGSTPIDFAYLVHTDIGHTCIGAKINNQIVPLSYQLNSGDIIHIMTSSKQRPRRDWLKIVKTPKAKSCIRHWFKEREKEVEKKETVKTTPKKEISKEKLGISKKKEEIKSNVIIPEIEGEVETYFAKCCNPIPGDEITGYITQGRGVSIHRTTCHSIMASKFSKEHFIKVKWLVKDGSTFEISLFILAYNREGLLADILNIVHESSTVVNEAYAKHTSKGMATGKLVMMIKNVNHLREITERIEKVSNVIKVYR
ncbi:bifunctional (p)ppGpp synthetase/guanosine-3',5'-bis(diphosphate) 3'-pyrophosphohydrolase [bacterium]|nr:bifunctional (p)ppGpp synthetase/guanosine-3',5'-bis(diphosphate) 3'-pyrophosphohydrolase [bacterium]